MSIWRRTIEKRRSLILGNCEDMEARMGIPNIEAEREAGDSALSPPPTEGGPNKRPEDRKRKKIESEAKEPARLIKESDFDKPKNPELPKDKESNPAAEIKMANPAKQAVKPGGAKRIFDMRPQEPPRILIPWKNPKQKNADTNKVDAVAATEPEISVAEHTPPVKNGYRFGIPPTPEIGKAIFFGEKALTVIAIAGEIISGQKLLKITARIESALPRSPKTYIHYDKAGVPKSRKYANMIFILGAKWPKGLLVPLLDGLAFECYTYRSINGAADWINNSLYSSLNVASKERLR